MVKNTQQPSVIWRLTLECGHLRITGPWDGPLNDEGTQTRHMIGDITFCEVCPRTARPRRGLEMMVRQVVNAEVLPAEVYRDPSAELGRARMDVLHA